MTNRSVPVDTVLPHVIYQDLPAALSWLTATFGFVLRYHYGEPLSGAQVHLGGAYIMLKQGASSRVQPGGGTQSLTIFVPDVDAHYGRTRSAGARIVEELQETCYGERQYGVEDPEGHRWLFSQHAHDVDPEQWGATLAEES